MVDALLKLSCGLLLLAFALFISGCLLSTCAVPLAVTTAVIVNGDEILDSLENENGNYIEQENTDHTEKNDDLIENNISQQEIPETDIERANRTGEPLVDEDGFIYYYPNPKTERQRKINELTPERRELLKRRAGY